MFYVGTCPHCGIHRLALQVTHVVFTDHYIANIYINCPNCKFPSCAVARVEKKLSADDYIRFPGSTQDIGLELAKVWPGLPEPEIPQSIPDAAKRAMQQAETNFGQAEHEEAAAIMYRKALEVALKNIDPNMKGSLASRIRKLSDTGRLTADLADWAEGIRNLGNDGAHEVEAIDRSELESMRGLVKMVLTYLFTLPAQVKSLRQDRNAAQ